jgi:hypothetical protein
MVRVGVDFRLRRIRRIYQLTPIPLTIGTVCRCSNFRLRLIFARALQFAPSGDEATNLVRGAPTGEVKREPRVKTGFLGNNPTA